MPSASEPKPPRNHDQELPSRRGEKIDQDGDKAERDKVPDTPPNEPEPVPVKEPFGTPEKRGPFIVHTGTRIFD
jgi:hypothetical protein